jgi:conjugative transposon TraN protein
MKTNRKKFASLLGLTLMLMVVAHAQPEWPRSGVQETRIQITFNKTSTIILPAKIKGVDRGSRDVLAQKANGVDNVIQLKAARENFPETNVTVITEQDIHHFIINYAREPESLTINLSTSTRQEVEKFLIMEDQMSSREMSRYAARIGDQHSKGSITGTRKYKMKFTLLGIFIKQNTLFCQLRLQNHTNIPYEVEFLRFYVQDKTKVKRTASQDVELKPLFTYGNNRGVDGKSAEYVVYALEKFTIPEAKHLVIEVFERNGGRNLTLTVRNKAIINARVLP